MLDEIFLHLKRVGAWLIVQTLKKGDFFKKNTTKTRKIVGFVH